MSFKLYIFLTFCFILVNGKLRKASKRKNRTNNQLTIFVKAKQILLYQLKILFSPYLARSRRRGCRWRWTWPGCGWWRILWRSGATQRSPCSSPTRGGRGWGGARTRRRGWRPGSASWSSSACWPVSLMKGSLSHKGPKKVQKRSKNGENKMKICLSCCCCVTAPMCWEPQRWCEMWE